MIKATIIGGEQLEAKLTSLPDKIISAVAKRVEAAANQVEADIKANKLSGQALHVRTGNLRRSVHHNPVIISNGKISATVGTNSEYAAIHEYGYQGPENVKAHARRITKVFGKALRGGEKTIMVRAYTRNVNYPERSFLRSTLKEDAEMIREQIRLGVQEGLQA
ncbi:MAG: hypothetical protein H6Q72_4283 [Firmicutes bacterium]|nr:hypothetical protein [Bacillota bacterium]